MLRRDMDYKIKLLKELNFEYTGDRYTHPCGLDLYCSDIRQVTDENFEEYCKKIKENIELLENYKKEIFNNCDKLLEEFKEIF